MYIHVICRHTFKPNNKASQYTPEVLARDMGEIWVCSQEDGRLGSLVRGLTEHPEDGRNEPAQE